LTTARYRGRGGRLRVRRTSWSQGHARGGEGEAGGGPEWPTCSGVPGGGRRRRPLVAVLRGGVLLGLARGGKFSGNCSNGWRRVGAVHVGGVRQWGAEERHQRQSEGVRDGDGVGDLSKLCFSPKTRQRIKMAELAHVEERHGLRVGVMRGGGTGRSWSWHGRN
jgi:hypothetical protein